MAFGDEKIVVDVKDTDHGEIEHTDKAGKKHTYYPCSNNWLIVESLEVLTALGEPRESNTEPQVLTRVRGIAKLEDRSISVVGDQSSKTKTITVSFEAGGGQSRKDVKTEDFLSFTTPLGGAMLGFNRADWEIGNENEWWVSCYVTEKFVSALVESIRSGQLASVHLGLALKGLYTTEHSYAPISMRGDLFIRPNARDNTIENPEMARGHVSSLHFASTKIDLRNPVPIEETSSDPEEPTSTPIAVNPIANAIEVLNTNVEKLRITLKWVCGLLLVALLILALK